MSDMFIIASSIYYSRMNKELDIDNYEFIIDHQSLKVIKIIFIKKLINIFVSL